MNQAGKPLKLLLTADTVGGVWTYALDLIKALAPYGTQIALATMGAFLSPLQYEQIKSLSNVVLYESNYKLEWMENPWEEVTAAGEWLLKINQEFKPDLIHLNNLVHGNLNWGKPVIQVVHSCVQSWWQGVKKEAAPESWLTYRHQVTQSLRAAQVVVAPTLTMLEEAETLYGPFHNHLVIHNGRDLGLFRYASKEPFIFSMGRLWDEAKNITLLTQVAAELSWPVLIAGNAQHPVTGKILKFPNVQFLGHLGYAAIADYLSRASIFALPAKYEPFGLSALEAGLSGCALVLGNIPSQKEIWQHTATYVDPNNAEQLKTTLSKLIEDEFIRNIFSYRALNVAQQYSAEQMASEYLDLYQQLL
ncbi:glycosyltransferase family 4 protein [Adhaeribacter swui]|uniref:Glycosyltransferase family 4 protein n=1 Tax=Adhaeribacter swui TaxID=2086471 RepID=A0A7G7GE50_9BACT|nr:glycosyltransferase family 4 protein [Adhaeribacter swui]QNF35434.1 glycosyltransferase family 4 protein [Adhaeribacter swui]